MSPASIIWLLIEVCREWPLGKAGEEARDRVYVELERRDWKRRSKGRKEGLGLSRPGLDATEGSKLLPAGEDIKEPCDIA